MKILFKNLIDSETGKNVVVHKSGDFDRKKFKKKCRKEQQQAKEFAKRIHTIFK
ncbi:hypothetical protein KAZ66_00065 [Candidatus Woesebacteria bacterium]|nr:hypothetical protein [Candidatus Woesebacteria bacterium]